MHTKKDAGFLITVVLSMLILAYISFVTVYEQILSQNNGFFNVIIYGVVLILVFIFITLFLRVITIRQDKTNASPVLNILISIGIISIFAFFIYVIPRYTSSISPLESSLYKTASYINEGRLAQAMDIHEDIIGYPANFVYGYFISIIFSIFDASENVYLIINTVMMVLVALFLYRTVKLISNIGCAVFALIVLLLIPNDIFLVYSYNPEIFVAMVFMLTLYLCELMIYKKFKSDLAATIIAVFAGISGGLLINCEPVMIISLIALCVYIYKANRQKTSCIVITLVISIIEFIAISALKALMMGVSFINVLLGQLLCFVPTHMRTKSDDEFSLSLMFKTITDRLNNPSRFLNDNSYFLTTDTGKTISASQTLALSIVDQFIILAMLILCVLLIVYILRVNYDKIMPILTLIVTMFIGQVLGGCNKVEYVYFIVIFILAGSTTLYYMFLNHHPDYAVYITNNEIRAENIITEEQENRKSEDNETEISTNEDLLRARALIFIGENEELYKQIKSEERQNRNENSIAATRIKTIINEEGEYDSVEEEVEYLDSPDEVFEVKEVHEVKAIPATRPVEVVKPVLADDYFEANKEEKISETDTKELSEDDYFDEPDIKPEDTIKPNVIQKVETETVTEIETKTIDDVEVKEEIKPEPPAVEGFVFRKKDSSDSKVNKKNEQVDKKAKQESKPKKEKKLKDIKPGEPLPNPLKGPKPPKKESLNFDFDSDGDDDFDWE